MLIIMQIEICLVCANISFQPSNQFESVTGSVWSSTAVCDQLQAVCDQPYCQDNNPGRKPEENILCDELWNIKKCYVLSNLPKILKKSDIYKDL